MSLVYNPDKLISANYRPFTKLSLYHTPDLVEMPSLLPKLAIRENRFLIFSGSSHSKPFQCFNTDSVFSFDFLEKTTGLPFYNFDVEGNYVENITDWGLNQFTKQYGKKGITKETIFQYVYAVLHNPAYREKYELNLKREFPRIPFYEDFKEWAAKGKVLMDLHINYETVKPYNLKEITADTKENPKTKLKADKETGTIFLDEDTTLTGIPKVAWAYKLGNRSALEWVLEQYRESKPKDPTIAEKFNTYKFADYKPQVIDLLKRVCTVSVETMKIIEQMS